MKHVRYTIYPTLTRVDFCCARTTAGRQDAADAVRARAGAFASRQPRYRMPVANFLFNKPEFALCDQILRRAVARCSDALPGFVEQRLGRATETARGCIINNLALQFSEGEPAINVYHPGGEFAPHEDKQRLTVLVALSDAASGAFVRKFGRPGDAEGEFKHPSGIALTPDNELIVADYQNDRLQVFDATTGDFVKTIGRHGGAEGEFERPFDVAIAPDGHILATDYENHRVQVLTPQGEYVSAHQGSP